MEKNYTSKTGYMITITNEKVGKKKFFTFEKFLKEAENFTNLDKEDWENLLWSKHVIEFKIGKTSIEVEQIVDIECQCCGSVTTFTTLELGEEWYEELADELVCEYCEVEFTNGDE